MMRCEFAALDKYPLIWAGHYSDGERLGEFSAPNLPKTKDPVANVGIGMMMPFALSPEVDASYLVVDGKRSDEFTDHPVLYVSGLRSTERGVWRTHWRVRLVEVRDIGRWRDEPEKAPTPFNRWDKALSDLTERRMHGKDFASFEDAQAASLHLLQSLLGALS
jgi:hypothetical protein